MEKQKTAVDFYDQQLHILDLRLKSGSITIGEYFTLKSELYTQAKQMEKEQIELAFFEGKNDGAFMERYSDYKHITANEYYNETYGKYENKA